jgi:hypothetical protein
MPKIYNLILVLLFSSMVAAKGIGSETDIKTLNSDSESFFANTFLSLDASQLVNQQSASWSSVLKPSGEDCTGSVPCRFLDPKKPQIGSFACKEFNQGTIEAVVLKTGESIVVVDQACEYYGIDFRFAFNELPSSLSDTIFWFQNTIRALRTLQSLQADDCKGQFKLLAMTKTLEREIKQKRNFGDFPMDLSKEYHNVETFRTVFEFLRVGYLPDKKGSFIEFDFYYGPL